MVTSADIFNVPDSLLAVTQTDTFEWPVALTLNWPFALTVPGARGDVHARVVLSRSRAARLVRELQAGIGDISQASQ